MRIWPRDYELYNTMSGDRRAAALAKGKNRLFLEERITCADYRNPVTAFHRVPDQVVWSPVERIAILAAEAEIPAWRILPCSEEEGGRLAITDEEFAEFRKMYADVRRSGRPLYGGMIKVGGIRYV